MEIPRKIEKKLGKRLKGAEITEWKIVKESIDARDKKNIKWIYTIDFETEPKIQLSLPEGGEQPYRFPKSGDAVLKERPVICGFGPAGMFCALLLAEAGYCPLVLERGKKAEERAADVERFWQDGVLDPESNVQFGEGGAGTFSDGKLVTGIKDPRTRKVLHELVSAGASADILYKHKPHIGTDVLRDVVQEIRKKIIRFGGEVLFSTKLSGIEAERGQLEAVTVLQNGTARRLKTKVLVLATGHSARDTMRMLYTRGLFMEQKPFSIGVRIEHPQRIIDLSQYGMPHEDAGLPPAEYKLSYRSRNGRGVYTFCMSPGGEVITASSENGMTATNGMSYHARDGAYANSALLVDVRTEDFGGIDPLAGIEFQEKYERLAFENSTAVNRPPCVMWGEFCGSAVQRSIPEFASSAIEEAMPYLARKLKDFDMPQARIFAVESRSSSPVRILRDAMYESNIKGLYPAGEGAGYAGGIMSAAADGIRIAEILISKYKKIES